MGDHVPCRKHSLVCKGRINHNWVSKSPGRSVRALCTGFGAPIPSGGQVEQTMEKIQKDYESNQEYQIIKSLHNKAGC